MSVLFEITNLFNDNKELMIEIRNKFMNGDYGKEEEELIYDLNNEDDVNEKWCMLFSDHLDRFIPNLYEKKWNIIDSNDYEGSEDDEYIIECEEDWIRELWSLDDERFKEDNV